MAIVAERALMTSGTEPFVRGCIKAMVFHKGRRMAEGIKRLERALLVIFVTFGATDLLTYSQRFRMGSRQTGYGLHLGACRQYHDQSGQCQNGKYLLGKPHFFPPLLSKTIL